MNLHHYGVQEIPNTVGSSSKAKFKKNLNIYVFIFFAKK